MVQRTIFFGKTKYLKKKCGISNGSEDNFLWQDQVPEEEVRNI